MVVLRRKSSHFRSRSVAIIAVPLGERAWRKLLPDEKCLHSILAILEEKSKSFRKEHARIAF